MLVYQTIAIFTLSVVHAGIDWFFYAVFASIHYQIAVLGYRLCELGHNISSKQPKYDIDKFDEIVELIQIHVQIDKSDHQKKNTQIGKTYLINSFVCSNIQACQDIFNTVFFIQVIQTVVGLSGTSIGLLHVSASVSGIT